MKKTIALFVSLIVMLMTISCVQSPLPSESTPSFEETPKEETPKEESPDLPEETPAPAPDMISLVDSNGVPVFDIVMLDGCGFQTVDMANDLQSKLSALSESDFELLVSDSEEIAQNCIIIGDTQLAELSVASSSLEEKQYRILVQDKKIILTGGCDAAIACAINEFRKLVSSCELAIEECADIVGEIPSNGHLVAFANQSEARLDVFDLSCKEMTVASRVWSFKIRESNVSDAKFRISDKYGEVVLIACSGNRYGCMVSYPSGEIIWETKSAAQNPHAIELLPNGIVAMASSEGDRVRFFNPTDSFSETYDAEIVLEDAHGVLWDDEREILYAIGSNTLEAYTVKQDNTKIKVTKVADQCATIPTEGAHDLSADYSNPDRLILSTISKVYSYDKNTGEFTSAYDEDMGQQVIRNVKGVGNFKDGSMVYVYPDAKYYGWTTSSAVFVEREENGYKTFVLNCQIGHFYKCRVFCSDYN